ncbi:hypothetical protein [Mesorhizobium sp.]|uniref:hypothetical protein n=1 Tax=Mesorhizobium sp. TaxID=1871066 RepID=UPI000FE4B04D|nr:hypothetical protein [Mesorhizobium sp.]RWD71067.1 MAG: hypothetical protein EOS37_12710 [Mesorhizobium sp.]
MNRYLLAVFAALALVAGGLYAWALNSTESADGVASLSPSSVSGQGVEKTLPIGFRRPVLLTLPGETFLGESPYEAREQIRDWLLLTVLRSFGSDASAVAGNSYETPVTRAGYTSSVGEFQNGVTRWAPIADDAMVVLVPLGATEAERQDAIAVASDEFVVRRAVRPTRAEVIIYCINDQNSPKVPQAWTASLERAEPIDGKALFADAYGWIESSLQNRSDLAGFLGKVDDLISLRVDGGRLTATGRKYRARTFRQITPEHVATILQSYEGIDEESRRTQAKYTALVQKLAEERVKETLSKNKDLADALDAAKKIINSQVYAPDDREQALNIINSFDSAKAEMQKSIVADIDKIREISKSCAFVQRRAQLEEKTSKSSDEQRLLDLTQAVEQIENSGDAQERSLRRGAPGFSLDPEYNFDLLAASIKAITAGDTASLKGRLVQLIELQRASDPDGQDGATNDSEKVADQVIDALVKGLNANKQSLLNSLDRRNPKLLRCMLGLVQSPDNASSGGLLRSVDDAIFAESSFQTARYDGGIAGTEVGQILFYTDLLAKLYGMDFDGAASRSYGKAIAEWVPTVFDTADPVQARADSEIPATRIWFGLRNDSFRLDTDRKAVTFGRTATRVFALSNSGTGEERELQPSSLDQRWVDFFNNNFSSIAAFEQRYDQLNQLTKWSLALDVVRGHLQIVAPQLADEMEQEPVRRNLWFPEWVNANVVADNKNISWLRCFDHPTRPAEDSVETVHIIHTSWPFAPTTWCEGQPDVGKIWRDQTYSLRGGVSLPREAQLGERAAIEALGTHGAAWRGQITAQDVVKGPESLSLKFAPEYGYQKTYAINFDSPSRAKVVSSAKAVEINATGGISATDQAVLFRGNGVELSDTQFTQELSSSGSPGTLSIVSSTGDGQLTRLSVNANDNFLAIEAEPLSRQIAQGLSVGLSRTPQKYWATSLLADPRVDAVVQIDKETLFARAGLHWHEFQLQPPRSATIAKGWQMRAADTKPSFLDLIQQPSVILSREVDEGKVSEKLADLFEIEVTRTPRETGSAAIMIRGPPGGPPPIDTTKLAFGSPEDPFRGNFIADDGSAVIAIGRRKPALNELVRAFQDLNLERLRSAGRDDTLLLQASLDTKLDPAGIAQLRSDVTDMLTNGMGPDARNSLAVIARVRKDLRMQLAEAEAANDTQTAELLQNDFDSAFRPNREEALTDTATRLRHDGRPMADPLLALFKRPLSPSEYAAELSKRAAIVARDKGAVEWQRNLQSDHIALAELSQRRLGTGLHVEPGADVSTVQINVPAPVKARKLLPGELSKASTIYTDAQYRLANLSDPLVLSTIERDAVVLEICDPEALIAGGVLSAVPDDIIVSSNIRLGLARSVIAKPTLADFGRGEQVWTAEYATFVEHLVTGYVCPGEAPNSAACNSPPSGNGGDSGGVPPDGSDSGRLSGLAATRGSLLLIVSPSTVTSGCFTPPAAPVKSAQIAPISCLKSSRDS